MEESKLTFGERVSDHIARFGSSWSFIFISFFSIVVWVVLNTLPLFTSVRWDEYPFILLNLFLSLIAAFQAPFILMAQHRIEKKQDEAYRGLFADSKRKLVHIDELLQELTIVLKNVKKILKHQSHVIDELEKELSEFTDYDDEEDVD